MKQSKPDHPFLYYKFTFKSEPVIQFFAFLSGLHMFNCQQISWDVSNFALAAIKRLAIGFIAIEILTANY